MSRKILISILAGAVLTGLGIAGYFLLIHRCPEACDDGNSCTNDFCSAATNYKCASSPVSDCCGNAICEIKENYGTCPKDCLSCDDNNQCTKDSYDYHSQKCVNAPNINVVCCGNTICEIGEFYENCARDCPNCNDNNKCTKDSYDYHKFSCVNEKIIPCCGNGICDKGVEKYSSCQADCPNCDDNSRLTADSFNYTAQKCEHAVTHYLIEDFENGVGDWKFFGKEEKEPVTTTWGIASEGSNAVLRGAGHNWAGILSKEWSNYIFKAKFKIIREGSGIHFNFRNNMGERNPTRYFIHVSSNNLNLAKQINEIFFDSIAHSNEPLALGEGWHTFEIRGYGNVINIFIDGDLLIKYKDSEDPVLSGGVAFETLDGSEFLIDGVEVKVISPQDVTYP